MSGDVFGNGMLLSRHIRLVAAFDHRHVFLDPDPDPARGFAERDAAVRTAALVLGGLRPRADLPGGGVFLRTAKSVPLSDEIRRALDVDAEALPPDELIRAILRAPVDLLWNGGIGTYVKATTETNADVGDKNNDAVRIDATELRCRVVGEGGNLGLTQRGRIEFAHGGGHINTDAIDNAAGVNCSDNEVNIKILLDRVVRDGDLTAKQRDTPARLDDRRRRRPRSSPTTTARPARSTSPPRRPTRCATSTSATSKRSSARRASTGRWNTCPPATSCGNGQRPAAG